MSNYTDDDLLPLSALQHLLFCPRQCALIHVEQLWAENRLTVEGRHLHEKADHGRSESRPGIRIARGLPLRSFRLGLVGKADVVEFHAAGSELSASPGAEVPMDAPFIPEAFRGMIPFPVEYKRGKPKPHDADRVQLCAQGLCLEEMVGRPVIGGAIFYGTTRRRLEVGFDATLRATTEELCQQLRIMIDGRITPPAIREKKCESCSLLNVCLPESIAKSASAYLSRSLKKIASQLPAGREDAA